MRKVTNGASSMGRPDILYIVGYLVIKRPFGLYSLNAPNDESAVESTVYNNGPCRVELVRLSNGSHFSFNGCSLCSRVFSFPEYAFSGT